VQSNLVDSKNIKDEFLQSQFVFSFPKPSASIPAIFRHKLSRNFLIQTALKQPSDTVKHMHIPLLYIVSRQC
jgi:hypothetical protein